MEVRPRWPQSKTLSLEWPQVPPLLRRLCVVSSGLMVSRLFMLA